MVVSSILDIRLDTYSDKLHCQLPGGLLSDIYMKHFCGDLLRVVVLQELNYSWQPVLLASRISFEEIIVPVLNSSGFSEITQ